MRKTGGRVTFPASSSLPAPSVVSGTATPSRGRDRDGRFPFPGASFRRPVPSRPTEPLRPPRRRLLRWGAGQHVGGARPGHVGGLVVRHLLRLALGGDA